MKTLLLIVMLAVLPAPARADGVPVSPDTPNAPPPPPPPPRPGKAPPDCVNKVLKAVYDGEKEYFAKTHAFSESLIEVHAASKIGLGCRGWELPEVKITYGGSGYTATMTETASGVKWIINQDKAVILEEKEIKAIVVEPEPTSKKK